MALQFTTTSAAGADAGIKTLVYGPAGVGKTCLCATAPYPIIFSAEAGLLSLRHFNIPVVVIKSVNDLTEAHAWFTQSHEARQFQTGCLDSVSEIAETILSNAKRQVKDPRQAYGELAEKTLATIKAFRDTHGKHIYMTAKMEPMKDEMTGIVKYSAAMPGRQLGPQLPYLFDEVFRLGVQKTAQGQEYRFLQTSLDLQYDAKDRSGALAPIEQPDLTHIFNKIQGAINGRT